MLLGYARVSTEEQHLEQQVKALRAFGCEEIKSEKASGRTMDRPELTALLNYARAGDTVVVDKLDRFSRNFTDIVLLANKMKEKGVGFKSLSEDWADTTGPANELIFRIFAGIAEFERERISERTVAGLERAKAQGKRLGRPPALSEQAKATAQAMAKGGMSMADIARHFDVSPNTIGRLV